MYPLNHYYIMINLFLCSGKPSLGSYNKMVKRGRRQSLVRHIKKKKSQVRGHNDWSLPQNWIFTDFIYMHFLNRYVLLGDRSNQ